MDGSVGVCLLGPIEVSDASGSSPLVGTKLQSLLAMLALSAPLPVSDDRLLEGLWGDEQPANPANALQALVSHLRRRLGRAAVERRGSGYVLALDADAIDTVRLERLVEQGRDAAGRGDHRTAERCYATATSLSRGSPLGDLADAWFAREAAARLGELVAAAHEGWTASALAMGRHADVVVALVDLVRQHPARERFRAQLMLALYRCGRQRDALQAYRDAREYLLEELGLDPDPELQEMERSILAHDPRLASPISLAPPVELRPARALPLTSFVGRAEELASIEAMLDAARLVTLVGPAGVGKTRLVLELCRHTVRDVIVIELASVHDAAGVREAVADAVGAHERSEGAGPHPDALARSVERVGERAVVIVLDNCEHVVDAVATVAAALLTGCASSRILATSREPIGLEGERQLVVGPLGVEASSELFVDRARAVQPHFAADAGHQGALADLCRHLDGLPLAIELAAARTKTLPLPEIAARLQDRFRLLQRVERAATSRHAGLGAAIDWSYDLLFGEERRVFRRLAVFAGGATIEAAEAVCGPDAFETASRLVDRSLVVADTSGDEVRFGMLESLRDYAAAQLARAGELDEARAAHLAWCTELAERANAGVRTAEQLSWLARLDRDHDNVRAALAYAVDQDPPAALRLIGALFEPWWFRGRRPEMRHWTVACLAAAPETPSIERARALAYQGFVAEPAGAGPRSGQVEDELRAAEERQRAALAMVERFGDRRSSAQVELRLMSTMTRRAAAGNPYDPEEFSTRADRSYRAFVDAGDHYGAGCVRVSEAIAALVAGDAPAAAAATEGVRLHAEISGERFLRSRVEYLLGIRADLDGQPLVAYERVERSLRLLDELGHESVVAEARLLVVLAERSGQPELASQWRSFVATRTGSWSHFDATVLAAAHDRHALAARRAGRLDEARASHTTARDWYVQTGLLVAAAASESSLGFLEAEAGDVMAARRHHLAALDAAESSGDRAGLALALEGAAGVTPAPRASAFLLGAAAALRRATSPARPPEHREDVRTLEAELRRALGDEGFADAARSGSAAPIADVVELARSGCTTAPG